VRVVLVPALEAGDVALHGRLDAQGGQRGGRRAPRGRADRPVPRVRQLPERLHDPAAGEREAGERGGRELPAERRERRERLQRGVDVARVAQVEHPPRGGLGGGRRGGGRRGGPAEAQAPDGVARPAQEGCEAALPGPGAVRGGGGARAQLLRSRGWGVEHIASSDWHSREHAGKVALVAMLLEKQGMGADPAVVEEGAAGDAEAPDEPSVTDDESEGEPVAEALA